MSLIGWRCSGCGKVHDPSILVCHSVRDKVTHPDDMPHFTPAQHLNGEAMRWVVNNTVERVTTERPSLGWVRVNDAETDPAS